MRLVDADALDDVIQILNEKKWGITRNNYKLIDVVLFEFPTIEERKKGKWILTQEADETGDAYYECSICHKGEVHDPRIKVNYCWNCGADMRGDNNE